MKPNNIQTNPILNLAAKMNTRGNNELLNIDSNSTGLELTNLENGDLFYSNSLSSREGVIDVCGGPINSVFSTPTFMSIVPSSGNAQQLLTSAGPDTGPGTSVPGFIYIPPNAAGDNIFSGNIVLTGFSPSNHPPQIQDNYDLKLKITVNKLNATHFGLGGLGSFSRPAGLGGNGNISFSSYTNTYNNNPLIVANTISDATLFPFYPEAQAETIFNLGPLAASGIAYYTNQKTVPYQFSSPHLLQFGGVYYIQAEVFLTSGTSARNILINQIQNTTGEVNSGSMFGESNTLSNLQGVVFADTKKTYLVGDYKSYNGSNATIADNISTQFAQLAPFGNGSGTIMTTTAGVGTNGTPWDASKTPPFVTNTHEFGQVISIPSGDYNIYGAYFYTNLYSGVSLNYGTTAKSYKRDHSNFVNTAGYFCKVSEILAETGSGTAIEQVTSRNVLLNFSGTMNFNNIYDNQFSISNSTDTNLIKKYAFFDEPLFISVTQPTRYLLSFGFWDNNTGGIETDYNSFNTTLAGQTGGVATPQVFTSPFMIGTKNFISGISHGLGLANYNDDGQTFLPIKTNQTTTGSPFEAYELTCGLIEFVNNGQAITGLYDYRIGDNRSQRVMFAQSKNLGFFELSDPTKLTIIYSGASIGDQFKWNFSTFQNLLIGCNYSQSGTSGLGGIVWDQINATPSTNWVQKHGLRPVFSGNSANIHSGTQTIFPQNSPGIPSGTGFQIMLGTQILSGGIRSSIEYSGTINSLSGNCYQIYGISSPDNSATFPYDIYHVSGLSNATGNSQYKFDVFSNGTYVFTTPAINPSGNQTYFSAPLCDSLGNPLPNPLPNNNTWNLVQPYYSGIGTVPGSGVYIYDINYSGNNAQQIPNIVNYGQSYFQNQVKTPNFKKTLIWNNLLIGIGDPEFPSRVWYSQIGAPQIWGEVGDVNYGFYDIDPDNGQVLTGVEIYKGYLIFFKENSTYTGQYTFTAGNPIQIQNIDKNKGNLSIFSTVSTSYGVFGISQYGPVLATYFGVETIGDEILPYFQSLNRTDLIFSVAIHDIARQQIYWSISDSLESQDSQIGLVYSYALKAWGVRRNGMWNIAASIGDTDNFTKLLTGNNLGMIKQINSGVYSDDSIFVDINSEQLNPVTLEFETPWMNFGGNSQILKQAKTLKINSNNSKQLLRIDVYYDENITAPAYTRILDLSQPVWNRLVSLSGTFRTVKFIISSYGSPDLIQINSMQLSYLVRSNNINMN